MQNKSLAKDYISRSKKRLVALKALYNEQAYADVVRESQEVVELALKGLLRFCNIEVPRIHDVSGILENEVQKLPVSIQKNLKKFTQISKSLRRDRELSFYGSDDLTPEEFYKEEDAKLAMTSAQWVVEELLKVMV